MRVAFGLGSNVGDRRAHLDRAVDGLRAAGTVLGVSRFLETAPVGGPAQAPYLNAAVVVETDRSPRALLALAGALESAAGRIREERWGPRPLDVDLLLCDELVVDDADLHVPHPRLGARRFVLAPLAEVAPDWVVPGPGRTVEELLAALDDGP